MPASHARDVFGPLVVLGASLSIAFVVLTPEAAAEVEPDERGLASGIFESANHLFGGAVGMALYASVLTATSTTASDADGYRAAFLAATGLALLGLVAASQARARPGPPAHPIDADIAFHATRYCGDGGVGQRTHCSLSVEEPLVKRGALVGVDWWAVEDGCGGKERGVVRAGAQPYLGARAWWARRHDG